MHVGAWLDVIVGRDPRSPRCGAMVESLQFTCQIQHFSERLLLISILAGLGQAAAARL
jgi:hypothetical protein